MFFYLHDLFPFDCLVNGDLVLLQFLIQVLPRFPLTTLCQVSRSSCSWFCMSVVATPMMWTSDLSSAFVCPHSINTYLALQTFIQKEKLW